MNYSNSFVSILFHLKKADTIKYAFPAEASLPVLNKETIAFMQLWNLDNEKLSYGFIKSSLFNYILSKSYTC